MSTTTLSSRQFNQDASRAKKAAHEGPFFITDRCRPAHVLLTFSDYQKMSGYSTENADLLAMTGYEDVVFDVLTSRELAQAALLTEDFVFCSSSAFRLKLKHVFAGRHRRF